MRANAMWVLALAGWGLLLAAGCEDKAATEQLNQELSQAKQAAEGLKEKLSKAEGIQAELKTARDALQKKFQESVDSLQKATKSLQDVTQMRDDLAGQLTTAKQTIASLETKVGQVTEEGKKSLESMMTKMADMQGKLQIATKLAEDRAKLIETLQAQIQSLKAAAGGATEKADTALPDLPAPPGQ
ncbi:MAG: hypothetical protein JW810_10855 [Sedimentisphaerales bacterium]|nr:hypothetical protein [Sedimentisphaerales bacterium]